LVNRTRPLVPPIGIFALALLVRVVYNLSVAAHYYPLHDSLGYQTIAFHLLDEHCYCWAPHVVTVSHGPLWPFLIAGLSLVAGHANLADRLLLSVLDAGTCVLIYYLAQDLFGKRVGLIAGLVASVYPALYIYTGWMYTESLFTFLQSATVYCVLRIQRTGGRQWWLWIVCGVLLGLLSLSHPNGVVVVGLVVIWGLVLVWRGGLPREALWRLILAVVVALALIAPWIVRDYKVSHSFVLVTSGSGTVLLGVYNNLVVTDKSHLGGWIGPGTSDPKVTVPYTSHICPAPCEVALESAET
jgi:4-amino-4-deoxy-L-arabinose transferase-like glycosyltransferase